jgi:ABC-2 type transport system permease protein
MLFLLMLMPILVMSFFRPLAAVALRSQGALGSNGAEQVVPGIFLMFSFLIVGTVGYSVFREHGWRTWDRLRTLPITTSEILVSKIATPLLLFVAQFLVTFTCGSALLGLHSRAPIWALAACVLVTGLMLISLGLAVSSVARSLQQVNAVANLGLVIFGTVGGAFVPVSLLPIAVRRFSPASPTYWSMRALSKSIVGGGGLRDIFPEIAVLLGFALAFLAVARLRFRVEEGKHAW